MGFNVEVNWKLALENPSSEEDSQNPRYLPSKLETGATHNFLKSNQRAFEMKHDIPLVIKGNPEEHLAEVRITEATHFPDGERISTRGIYIINKVLEAGMRYNNRTK